MSIRPGAPRVRRRSELAKKHELVERSLELAPAELPVDARERAERRLDGGPLAAAREVRAQPGAKIPGAPDVERLPACVTEDVRPGRGGCQGDERALSLQASGPRRRQLDEIGDRLGAALLREPDQRDQDLCGRLGVGERAMAWRRQTCRRSARAAASRTVSCARRGVAARATPCRRPARLPADP